MIINIQDNNNLTSTFLSQIIKKNYKLIAPSLTATLLEIICRQYNLSREQKQRMRPDLTHHNVCFTNSSHLLLLLLQLLLSYLPRAPIPIIFLLSFYCSCPFYSFSPSSSSSSSSPFLLPALSSPSSPSPPPSSHPRLSPAFSCILQLACIHNCEKHIEGKTKAVF